MIRRGEEYARETLAMLHHRLGYGKDGTVWESDRDTAIKVFRTPEPFERERAVYERLRERGVMSVAGFSIPQLVRVDERLMVVEMTIVTRPFVLDFGSAYLDGSGPEFPEEIMAEWLADTREKFGARWGRAVSVLRGLERLGIQLTDVHPGNIGFADDGGDA
ncbi:MAG TPA: hypothetical protein PKE29_17775 [Phycisphaerales bacterium]|nr:hypothetical protein [Phycisphaerales bacterium]